MSLYPERNKTAPLLLCTKEEQTSVVRFNGQKVFNVLKFTHAVCSVWGQCCYSQKCIRLANKRPRNAGKSAVAAERWGRASRSNSDEKMVESSGVFLQY